MPNLINERDLRALLAESKGVVALSDKPGSDDYAFLEETVLPTLLPALVQMLETVQEKEQNAAAANAPDGFNSIRWLAERLMRTHPNGGVFKPTHPYAKSLAQIGERQKEARLERERVAAEEKAAVEAAAAKAEAAKVEEMQRARREKEEARAKAKEANEAEKNLAGEQAAAKAMGDDRTPKILEFRKELLAVIAGYDFRKEDSTVGVNSALFKMASKMVVTDTAASFSSCADLLGEEEEEQMIHLHTAADKKETPIEEDEEDEEEDDEVEGAPEKPVKIAPPPEISVRDLPALDHDEAFLLRRGTGISWPAIDEGKLVLVTDTKYSEGTVFFDGEKRQGTYACVCIMREGKPAGLLTADTLDSMTGKELIMSDVQLMHAIAVVLGEALDLTTSALMAARRATHTERIRGMSKDPNTVPGDMARAVVEGLASVVADREIAVGVADTADKMRLLACRNAAGHMDSDIVLFKHTDPSERATLFFEASANADTASTRDDAGSVLAIAHCTADETSHAFCSAIYISAASSGKPLTEETLDFVQAIAPLTAPVLLPPTQNAHRTLAMLAAAGAGDGTPLYEAAVELCDRHCGAQSGTTITIAFAHGDDMMRVVKSTGSSAFRGATAQRSDLPMLFSCVTKAMYVYEAGTTCIPLMKVGGGEGAFGAISVGTELLGEAREAIEGVAAALSSAMSVCDLRRKLSVCGGKALQSLQVQAPGIKECFFAFYDVGDRLICSQASAGGAAFGWIRGQPIPASDSLRLADLKPRDGGSEVKRGVIGSNSESIHGVAVGMYEDTPEEVMRNVATTMSRVCKMLEDEGMLLDHQSQAYKDGIDRLETNFNACRFDRVMQAVIDTVDFLYIDNVKHSDRPLGMIKSIIQSIMYILGHQELDVSEWPKCRKLITHHLFKEMKMIDVRGKLKVHKLNLAKERIAGLNPGDIAMEVGPKALMLWKWVCMMLDVQGVS